MSKEIGGGLRGVVALESSISYIDGEKGILEYRGYNIHDLAKYSTYEAVAFLLLYGYLPSAGELERFSDELAARRELPFEIVDLLKVMPKITHPMVVLRTAISYLGSLDRGLGDIGREDCLLKSKNLLAKMPTIVAYYEHFRQSKDDIHHPDERLGHADNFLWMLWGREPNDVEKKAMDLAFILHAEHGLNASTFNARVTASTEADFYAGVVSGTGALFGRLHGGASQEVMKMLRLVDGKNVQQWIDQQLEQGQKIMGFGHAVYKCADPRAEELKVLAEKLDSIHGNHYFGLCEEICQAVQERRPALYPNVDFYAAAVYANLDIPDDLFISVFALSRIAGWASHIIEQNAAKTLIRPLEKYIGKRELVYPV